MHTLKDKPRHQHMSIDEIRGNLRKLFFSDMKWSEIFSSLHPVLNEFAQKSHMLTFFSHNGVLFWKLNWTAASFMVLCDFFAHMGHSTEEVWCSSHTHGSLDCRSVQISSMKFRSSFIQSWRYQICFSNTFNK